MILGQYEQRALYKRYNVGSDGGNSVLETFGATFNPENVLSKVLGKK